MEVKSSLVSSSYFCRRRFRFFVWFLCEEKQPLNVCSDGRLKIVAASRTESHNRSFLPKKGNELDFAIFETRWISKSVGSD